MSKKFTGPQATTFTCDKDGCSVSQEITSVESGDIGRTMQIGAAINSGWGISSNPYICLCPKHHKKTKPKTTIDQLQPLGYVLYSNSLSPTRITLEAVSQLDNSVLWAIRRGERVCYNRSTKRFDYEPQPSNRTKQFLKTHRFKTVDEALAAWDSYKRTKDYADMMARYAPSEASDA